MKRVIALILTVGLLCSLTPALAFDVPKHINEFDGLPVMPRLSDFAAMHTWQEEEIVTIYLDKPVDNLRANWLEYNNEHEEDLEVTEDVDGVWTAQLDTTGHKYQVGAHWTNAYATETYIPYDSTKNEDRYQTMLRTSDAAEGYRVGDTMAQRNNLHEATSGTSVQKNDSAVDELRGYLYNDQPENFTKHEIEFTAGKTNAQIEASIETFRQIAEQEAEAATDALGQSHYDQYGNRADLQNYYCVKVEEPFYAVVKTLEDGKFCILSRYKYTTDVRNITVPSGFKLYRVNGFVTAWHPTYAASDGTSDGRYTVAYLSDQTIDGETWTVAYGRNGKIQWFYLTMYDTELFGQDMGTAIVKFEPCNTGWFIREVTEMYEDGSYVSAFYNRTGNGKLSYYKASEFLSDEPAPYSGSGRNAHSNPYDSSDYDDPDLPVDEEEDYPSDYDDDFGSEDDDDFGSEDDDDFGSDYDDDFPSDGEDSPEYFVYEYDEPTDDGSWGMLHTANCRLVRERDANDNHWAAYNDDEGFDLDLFRIMYTPCDVCNP